MTTLLETKGLSYSYASRKHAKPLDGVSIKIDAGVRTAVLGANGAGKSTLFYSLNGIFKPKSGEVLFKGSPLEYTREALRELRSAVCVVVQNPDEQIFSSTVEEDVAFGPLNMGLPRDEVEERIVDSLTKVGMLEYRYKPATHLSYGQRKRVALAGALAVDPEVLILDEPTAGLDPKMTSEMLEIIDLLTATGTTVIMSTHDIDMAYSWAEDAHILSSGHSVYSGPPQGFFSDERKVLDAGLVMPRITKLHESLGFNKGDPRTVSQLLACMDGSVGKIELHTIEEGVVDPEGRCISVVGPTARKLLKESEIKVDLQYDALERACIVALGGNDVVMYTDKTSIDAVANKIRSLSRFGRSPEVVL